MLAMAESMLNLDSGAAEAAAAPAASVDTTAPKLPLRESLSSTNNDRSSRSSAGSGAGKAQVLQQAPAPATPAPATSKLLSGQEQDAVVAKIRSAAKRSASPEKKLPYQDDDTPNTKGARLKKEMEVSFGTATSSRVWLRGGPNVQSFRFALPHDLRGPPVPCRGKIGVTWFFTRSDSGITAKKKTRRLLCGCW